MEEKGKEEMEEKGKEEKKEEMEKEETEKEETGKEETRKEEKEKDRVQKEEVEWRGMGKRRRGRAKSRGQEGVRGTGGPQLLLPESTSISNVRRNILVCAGQNHSHTGDFTCFSLTGEAVSITVY